MQIVRNVNNIENFFKNSYLTIGNFDGLHLGHKKILEFNKNLAEKDNKKTSLLTFEPHPRHFFNPNPDKSVRIYSLSEKLNILRKENLVDIVFLIHFNNNLSSLKAEDFIENILCKNLNIESLTVGYDFNFGKNRSGNAEMLENLSTKFNYNFHKVDAQKSGLDQIYSSTSIRNLLQEGNIKSANNILNRNYSISGQVSQGQKLGRKIGFKTANINPKSNKFTIKYGVYKTKILLDGEYFNSITNFGVKPTISGKKEIFETHIFNFNKNIYGKKIKVEFLDFIREERKFDNIDELKLQIQKDCKLVNKDV